MKASETPVEPVVAPRAPVIISAFSHAGEIHALDSDGSLFRRVADPKDFNQGPNSRPKFLWVLIEGPHSTNV